MVIFQLKLIFPYSAAPWNHKYWQKSEPDCPKNLQQVGGSRPLADNFELFAKDQDEWVKAFIPALEKMLSNGYGRYVFLIFVICNFKRIIL